jgi:hypothetical protein
MIARLERHVRRRAANVVPARGRIAQRFDFSMRVAAHVMVPLAEGRRPECDHRANGRIWRGATAPALREFARAAQIDAVERGDYLTTSTPFQKATRSLICFAASLGVG